MSEYIMDLRRAVGHRPLLQLGASVIVEDGDGRVLLERRADCGKWAYAGGSVELDESVEDAARREVLEETGIAAGALELFGVFSGPQYHYVYPNGDEVSNVDIVFVCRDWSGDIEIQKDEVTEARFFAAGSLPAELFEPTEAQLRLWEERKLKEKNNG